MKFGATIAVFFLTVYFIDNALYGGKFTVAAGQITSRMITSFR